MGLPQVSPQLCLLGKVMRSCTTVLSSCAASRHNPGCMAEAVVPDALQVDQCTANEYPPGVGLSAHIDTHSAFTGVAGSQLLRYVAKSVFSPPLLLLLSPEEHQWTSSCALPLRGGAMLAAKAPAHFFLLMCRRHCLCLSGGPHSRGVQAGAGQLGPAGASTLPAGDERGKSAGLGALHPP